MRIKYKDIKVKKYYFLLPLFCIVLFSAGCGYNVGKISNPQIETIAFAPIKNECYLPNMSEYMRNALAEAFQVDGSYKVRSMYDADCILYGRITETKVTAVDIRSAAGGTIFTTREFNMAITFEFTLVIPGQADALVQTTSVTGNAQYAVPVDQFTAQQNGIKQASWDAANQVVWSCAEAW
jgi:hypothetical protein